MPFLILPASDAATFDLSNARVSADGNVGGLTNGQEYVAFRLSSPSAPFRPVSGARAPVFTTMPSLNGPADALVGATFTLSEGVATGKPAPTLTGTLTLNGADVTPTSGSTYVATDPGTLVWTVRAANGVGTVVASATTTVSEPASELRAPVLSAGPGLISVASAPSSPSAPVLRAGVETIEAV